MANRIILKRSSVAGKVPLATDLSVGEIALNLADAKLYSKDGSGNVISVGGGSSGGGAAWAKANVKAATTANITLSGTQTVDGIALAAGDRVLVKDQSTASANGIYVVSATAWARSTDADTAAELAGSVVAVDSGTTNGGLRFDTDFKSTDTLGTTSVTFSQVVDVGLASSTNPAMDGTVAVGTSVNYARADHVHPTDTSRAPLASPTFTGTPAAPTAAVNTNTTQIATTAFVNAEIANDAAPIGHVGATGTAHGVATTAVAGFMSSTDKTKLDGIAAGATANTGTVTSVGLSLPAQFSVSGSPVTGSGTLTAAWASQTANYVFAAPNGSAGTPTFRALVAADIPALTLENIPDAWVKRSVKCATTANITLSGTQTIDGIAVVAGDRVLVKDQSTASANGIYVVSATAWSRAADADTASEIAAANVGVDSGTTNGGFTFDNDFKSTDTLGTTAMTWSRVVDTGLASSTTPNMDGTAAVGTSVSYARADHTHPTDTSRAPLASPTFTGTPAAPTAAVGTSTTQLATTAFVNAEIANDAFLKAAGGSIVETVASISANYTMTTGSNGLSAGPISIASGVTVTIPSGSTWAIV